jgi:hypothetical protein
VDAGAEAVDARFVERDHQAGTPTRDEAARGALRFARLRPAVLGEVKTRAVRIRPDVVARLSASDLDVVLQRPVPGEPFDLVIATNILVYYDTFEQSLALANIAAMLRPGGFLLSNNALLELPRSRMRSVGYSSTAYSSLPSDGDRIVWYRRRIE